MNPFPGERKRYPVLTGLLRYFPRACAAVANCSLVANEQHNPGEPMRWAKDKSIGQGDEDLRHLMEAGTIDSDGIRHTTKHAWRALELLERELEAEDALSELVGVPHECACQRASRVTPVKGGWVCVECNGFLPDYGGR